MPTTTESAVSRALQAYTQLLAEATSLDWGIAYVCPRYPDLNEANQLREIILESDHELPKAFENANAHYAEHDLACRRWAPALDQSTGAVADFLSDKGFKREEYTVMNLTEWREFDDDPNVRILPARAMRKALDTILPEMAAASGGGAAQAEAAADRLDDHRVEGVVAMIEGDPVGYCALFEVGDIGMLADLYVSPAHRRKGVGTALVAHLLKQARRLQFRVTCVRVPKSNDAATALFQKCGLSPDGQLVEFVRTLDAPD